MRPIRAFLFFRGENDQWACQVFRDFEPLLEAAIAANDGRQYPVGVHVGFERPETRAVEDLLSKQEGLVFLSNGAVGTMPLPVRASQRSIGSAGGSSFHAALDGFGYQVEQPNETPPSSIQPVPLIPVPQNTGPRDWVAALSTLESDLAKKLYTAGIWDEDSYLLKEAELDAEIRYRTGLRRYELLEGEEPNATSLIDHLRSTPPWILNTPISRLNLTVRSRNVCAAHGIKMIGDFTMYGLKGLYRLPNLGQKSVDEISREIIYLFTKGYALKAVASKPECNTPVRIEGISTDNTEGSEDSAARGGVNYGFHADTFESINSGFIGVAQKLSQNERGVWFGRLGFRCEPMTLQQIADQIGVTRERVRQIETKIYRKVHNHPFWNELSRRVREHLNGRTSPLFLHGLSAIDPWFEGVDQLVHPMREVSGHIPGLCFHILTWSDLPVISTTSQAQWNESIEKAKSILMAIADRGLSEQEALTQASNFLIGKGEDMREALHEEVSKFCVWSTRPDGTRILTGFGKSAAVLVLSVLQASDIPLHIDTIQRRVSAYSVFEPANARYIHKTASEVGILYGRGTYGLMKHCPLNSSQMQAIRAEAEDIISGGLPSKQWHSSEIYDELLTRGFAYEGKLTKYIVNIALSDSTDLVYLRRMIWGVRGKWSESASARLDVKQAIISLLEEEGKPMSTAQIRSRLIEGRGLNTYFQIWASSPLVRLGPGLWGLEGRDLDMQHARALAYRLLKELTVRQEGMHVAEVAAFLGLGSEDEVSMLSSIANADGLRLDRGQYFYLQPWGESRRISIWDAANSILKAHPEGLHRDELQLFVERIAKRKVDRMQLSSILQNIDATYDAASSLWKFTGQADEDNEDDEGSADSSVNS